MVLAGELVVTTSRLRRGLATLKETGASWTAKGGENDATLGDDVERLGLVAGALEESIRAMRLLPLSVLFHPFPRLVRDTARTLLKEVRLVIEGGDTTADKRILEELKDPLMHMVRNALDHGIEGPDERQAAHKPREATLSLRARQTATSVVIELADDGRGLDLAAIRRTALQRRVLREEELDAMSPEQIQSLIFAPGFSTSPSVTALSGRGVGLDVVRANVERLKGTIQVESHPGEGCRFQLRFPITLATTRVLLVRVARWTYALPVEFVEGALLVDLADIFTLEGRPSISVENCPVPAVALVDLLELPDGAGHDLSKTSGRGLPARRAGSPGAGRLPCILLSMGSQRLGLLVDELLDEQEVMLKPLGGLLQRVRNVSGATILSSGEVCMVLNCQDLLMSLLRPPGVRRLEARVEEERPKLILLVEDSITTRTQEKRILEGAGYEVVTAVDGIEALDKLGTRPFDAVVSDIEMPNLDGLALTTRIRQDPQYRELPVILVTTLSSEEDRRRGAEAGANAYITKATFDQRELVETVRRLV
jgi:two-component system chemotaxis sensor kinase CheA